MSGLYDEVTSVYGGEGEGEVFGPSKILGGMEEHKMTVMDKIGLAVGVVVFLLMFAYLLMGTADTTVNNFVILGLSGYMALHGYYDYERYRPKNN
jgi:hypothetical protein